MKPVYGNIVLRHNELHCHLFCPPLTWKQRLGIAAIYLLQVALYTVLFLSLAILFAHIKYSR